MGIATVPKEKQVKFKKENRLQLIREEETPMRERKKKVAKKIRKKVRR